MEQENIGQSLPPGTRLEEFVIERVLGAGGFGQGKVRAEKIGERAVVEPVVGAAATCYRDL